MKQATMNGTVVLRKWAEGSKSEHEAYCLETVHGTFKLRWPLQTNPFELDGTWEQYSGKRVTITGQLLNNNVLTADAVRLDESS